uniref:Uncharacterized protein n=1 Tax=Ciona intestinalis TaxID=7719 RepID=H2Y0X4_CIOIN
MSIYPESPFEKLLRDVKEKVDTHNERVQELKDMKKIQTPH